ncbi:MAG TPA: DNA ligase D [Gemmatimonadales bacterium]|jgi:bifunctional non-homologous end joining protein LigD
MTLRFTAPQLARLEDVVPEDRGWAFEVKYDGYRLQALVATGQVRLLTRTGLDWTHKFPTIATWLARVDARSVVLDGEVIAANVTNRSAFGALQEQLEVPGSVRLQYVVFDILELNGTPLRREPLARRWELLRRLLRQAHATKRSTVRLSERLSGAPGALMHDACARRLEGVIGKRLDAPYQSGRGPAWIKVKCTGRQEFVLVGFTPPKGSRVGIGSLLLAVYDHGTLHYAGRVGSGLTDAELGGLLKRLTRIERRRSPLQPVPTGIPRGVRWLAPTLVAEVSFTEWTADGHLRHPVFQGLRTDKAPADVHRERISPMPRAAKLSPTGVTARTRRPAVSSTGATVAGVTITHPDREVYPEAGISKLELARYLERVAQLMLPHVADRPLALVRCPEGIAGECFFQKHWTGALPSTLNSVPILQNDGKRHPHVVVRNAAALVTLAQWGVVEIHPWGARADKPDLPDRITFDLDPHEDVPWSAVRDAANGLRTLLRELGFASWLKTSGGKGLHVVLPITRRSDWAAASAFARAVAEHMAAVLPDLFLAKASKAERTGRIFIDWLRNTRGATAVAPWSPRARPAAGVSVPINWTALPRITSGDQYRLNRLPPLPRRDPWAALLGTRQALTARALTRLRA